MAHYRFYKIAPRTNTGYNELLKFARQNPQHENHKEQEKAQEERHRNHQALQKARHELEETIGQSGKQDQESAKEDEDSETETESDDEIVEQMRERALLSSKKNMAEYDSEEESDSREEEGKEKERTDEEFLNPTTGPKPVEGDGKPGTEVHNDKQTGRLTWDSTKVKSGYTAKEEEGLKRTGAIERTTQRKRASEEDDEAEMSPSSPSPSSPSPLNRAFHQEWATGKKKVRRLNDVAAEAQVRLDSTRKRERGRSKAKKATEKETRVRDASETPPRTVRRKIMFNAEAKKRANNTEAKKRANNTRAESPTAEPNKEVEGNETNNQKKASEANATTEETNEAEGETEDVDFKSVQDEVEEMILEAGRSEAELQANAVVQPLIEKQAPGPTPEIEAQQASKEPERESQEEGDAVKSWHEKDVNSGHQPLGEFSQMNDMLEQIPEVMEGDAFSLTCATKEGLDVLVVLEEEVEMARELPTGEEDLRHDEEAAHRRKAQLLPADDVDMASAVKTDSVDKGENEQNGQANPGQEPTLDEAADIIKTGDATAKTSKNEGRTAAKERTADHAGSPDGGADL